MFKVKDALSVLVIEDNEMFRRLALDMLNGYTVYSAVTAREGLSIFNKHKPKITFIDIGLPDQSGHDIVSEIKKIEPNAFMVMLTASNLEIDVKTSLKNGAQGYIVKPFSRQKIKESIEKYYAYEEKVKNKKTIKQ